MNHLPTITRTAFHDIYVTVLCVLGGPTRQFKDLFQERLALIQNPKSEKDPQDLIQMMFRYAQENCSNELNLDDMTRRLCILDVGTFQQASIAITNAIFNIVTSDKEYNTITALREEFATILAANGNTWTRLSISQMMKADSICRETLRVNAFANRSVFKQVMVDGLRTEDGILLPKGALLSVLASPVHGDGDLFKDPDKFDPYRFSRIREDKTLDAKEKANLTAVSTGPQFLPFGHGKNACPGRFFFDFEFKMIIAYLFMNYDIELPKEYGGKRPENKWVSEAMMPPTEGKLSVKRRKDTTT
jgi:cytochrome P450